MSVSTTAAETGAAQPPERLAPTLQRDRFVTLDALRGFALLGVLIVNILQGYSFVLTGTDEVAATLIRAFGEGTFYPMFSFLFGLGFALQLKKGEAALPRFRRRLVVLLGIGLVHGLLIWVGDILFTYAVLGFVLIFFRNLKGRTLLTWALLLWLFSLGIYLLTNFSLGGDLLVPKAELGFLAPMGDTYLSAVTGRLSTFPLGLLGIFLLGPSVLALFIVGYLVGRKGVLEALEDRYFLRRVALTCGVVAAPFALWFLGVIPFFEEVGWLYVLEFSLASPLLSFAYLAGLALFAQPRQGLFRLLIPVGQMALSNYLGQSLICTTLFYPYAFNLYGKLGAATTLMINLVIFAVQVVVSRWWLSRYRFGPAEWVWRSLTYGVAQPLRRGADVEGSTKP